MTATQRLLVIGFYINSALYLAGCALFGWLTNHPWSWKLAVLDAGLCCISYTLQVALFSERLTFIVGAASWVIAIFAGINLMW